MLPSVLESKAVSRVFAQNFPKYFNSDEVRQILSDSLRQTDYDAYFLCLFLWNTGVRVSEALSVKIDDINLMAKALKVTTLKRTGHVRVIPIQNGFVGEIALWINLKGIRRGDYLFQISRKTAYNHVRSACVFAGIKDDRGHPHSFRHSYAVNCILHGVPITVLQHWLGHRDITKTLIYTQILAQDTKVFMENVVF